MLFLCVRFKNKNCSTFYLARNIVLFLISNGYVSFKIGLFWTRVNTLVFGKDFLLSFVIQSKK